ncbi:MAG: sigma-70 family RNA polymerase sigma factor [Saprospiraceae bacterium]|nr:sigma-70 family RNA polymerase sigma factor [Saprospiraceae bacterium]
MDKLFLKIIEENQGIIYKVCKMYRDGPQDQEDLFQEIVLQLWKAFPKFRAESKVSTWMYRIALNTAIATFRKNTISLSQNDVLPDHMPVSTIQETSENEEKLFEAIRKLNQAERALIALFLEDYSYKEIAHLAGITENNVGVKISRIKEKLKIILN